VVFIHISYGYACHHAKILTLGYNLKEEEYPHFSRRKTQPLLGNSVCEKCSKVKVSPFKLVIFEVTMECLQCPAA
jgi:hypothetical protein